MRMREGCTTRQLDPCISSSFTFALCSCPVSSSLCLPCPFLRHPVRLCSTHIILHHPWRSCWALRPLTADSFQRGQRSDSGIQHTPAHPLVSSFRGYSLVHSPNLPRLHPSIHVLAVAQLFLASIQFDFDLVLVEEIVRRALLKDGAENPDKAAATVTVEIIARATGTLPPYARLSMLLLLSSVYPAVSTLLNDCMWPADEEYLLTLALSAHRFVPLHSLRRFAGCRSGNLGRNGLHSSGGGHRAMRLDLGGILGFGTGVDPLETQDRALDVFGQGGWPRTYFFSHS